MAERGNLNVQHRQLGLALSLLLGFGRGVAVGANTGSWGDQARFAYSTDGESFRRFGPEFTIKFGNWCGDRLGFYCWNDNIIAGYVDIDYFHYDYDGPKGR